MNEELKVIISAETADLKKGVKDAKGEIEKLGKSSKVNMQELKNGFQKAGEVAQKGLAIAAKSVAAVGAALLAVGPATKEFREGQAKLATAFETSGSSAETAKQTYNDLYRVLGDSDVAVEASNHLAKLTNDQQSLSEWTTICQGVYATFGDSLPIEGLTEAANETAKTGALTGSLADALNWAGVSEDEFQEKLDATNSEAEREQLIRETLNGLYTDAAASYEENASAILAQNEANAKMEEGMAAIGEAMEPINTMLTELGGQILSDLAPHITEFAENHGPQIKDILSGIGDAVGTVINFVADHWDIIAPIAAIIAGIAAALAALNVVLSIQSAIMLANPTTWIVLGIVAAITALVAIIVVCIKHWDEIKAKVSEVVEKIKTWVGEMVDKVKEKFENMKKAISDKVEAIKKAVKEKFEAIKKAITDKVEEAKTAVKEKFEAIKKAIGDKVDSIKTTVSDKFNNIKTTMSDKVEEAKNKVTEKFENIKKNIGDKMDGAKDKIKSAIDRIKELFNFHWEFPKLKMPHFSIKGSFSLDPPSVPHLSVSWYARGGVFDSPTLFGYGNGMLGGLGENGAEAVVPLEKNTEWLDKIAEKLRGNSNQRVVLQVDGKTFATIACDSINNLSRQRGSLPIRLV